ncbi:MAG: hypothetical protein OEZ43_21425 [Gammaproteobacteria bacterium]|nr:hypothetical protein [Gammaproteobacteria bacterium]
MIEIGTNSFLIKVPNLPQEDFERYSSALFDEWEKSLEKTLHLSDYSISLEIEEGSIKGKGKIAATLTVLYFGIGSYADFVSGLETINNQVSYASNALFKSAASPFGGSNANVKTSKRGGAVSQLRSLFNKVQSGDMTVDEAMDNARVLLGEEGEEVPEFMRELENQLEKAPRIPKQLAFDDEEWEEVSAEEKPKTPKKPGKAPTPIPQQYRVVVWRESKGKKKHIKVSKL